ncbi:MAG: glycoside hydrolase family 127 protein [Bacteroidales bacterium]
MRKNKIMLILAAAMVAVVLIPSCATGGAGKAGKDNLAVLARSAQVTRGGQREIRELNDGLVPDSVPEQMRRWMSNPNRQQQRQSGLNVMRYEYVWEQPVTIDEVAVFLYDFDSFAKLPQAYRFKYWNGEEYVDVENPSGLGLENDIFNHTTFTEVSTTKLMLEVDSVERFLSPVLEWQVFKPENAPAVAPVIAAGGDRMVVTGGKTYLSGLIRSVDPLKRTLWTAEGPGAVTFEDSKSDTTSATFTVPGEYVLTLSAQAGKMKASSSLKVSVVNPPEEKRLDVVYTRRYKIDSPLWNDRAKALIVDWIPHCITMIERTDLERGQGGIDNFIEAAKALRGEPHGKHLGYVFSNAWVHQTIESMCIALMVDPQGDKEIIAAQEKMKKTLEKWIPIVLAAQEPDGYLQTAFTLRDTSRWKERWAPETRGNHEGYVAGYFIESAINHYTLTEGTDTRLYDAAKKLSDCWVANIGPGKKAWYDGHQEMEQALVRFGRFVNDMEGNGRGDSYIQLAKFLLDNRDHGSEYDQSHVPVQQQYEAVGHAVRAVYNYSGMADVAAETGDTDYQSAVMSLWDNMVNKKYYVTGGVGSGETSEGFGGNYSLGNNAYCESCSSCGLIFFQHKMNIAYHDAKYADLYEETIYNALLGSLDYEGKHFFYTNPLSSNRLRSDWHVCPCCVGNIPRTLLMIPTWTYVKSDDGIYVNLFIGSTINVEKVAGTTVEMVQKTEYPWKGDVSITVNPAESKKFTVWVRVPDRETSDLYKSTPEINTISALAVNGESVTVQADRGYVPIIREWQKGDVISFVIPMEVQTITADERIVADRGRIALRYGPMIYNVEKADQPDIDQRIGDAPLSTEWRNDMFGGILIIKGKWSDGSDLLAIPNYVRLNRSIAPDAPREGEQARDWSPTSIVWINKEAN